MADAAYQTGVRGLLLACALTWVLAGGGCAEARARVQTCPEPIAVDVVGESRASQADAHAAALADARRNAVLRACPRVEAGRSVEDMRLAERTVRVRAAGIVEALHVIRAGAVSGSIPPVYRVRARAAVRALSDRAACAGAAEEGEEGGRAVALELAAARPEQAADSRDALTRELQRLGVVVGEDVKGAETPLARVRVAGRTGGPWTASWDVSARVTGGTDRGTAAAAGYWLLSGHAGPGEFPWADLARALAEDLARLTRVSSGTSVPEPAEGQTAAAGPTE